MGNLDVTTIFQPHFAIQYLRTIRSIDTVNEFYDDWQSGRILSEAHWKAFRDFARKK